MGEQFLALFNASPVLIHAIFGLVPYLRAHVCGCGFSVGVFKPAANEEEEDMRWKLIHGGMHQSL